MIILVDFGSQTTHLILRRIRELGADVKIVNPDDSISLVQGDKNVEGIICPPGTGSKQQRRSTPNTNSAMCGFYLTPQDCNQDVCNTNSVCEWDEFTCQCRPPTGDICLGLTGLALEECMDEWQQQQHGT